MEEILDLDKQEDPISEKEIFTKIWFEPRRVFRFITDHQFDKYTTWLLILSGISRSFDQASLKNRGDSMSLFGIILSCVVLGGLFGWIFYYFYAGLMSWTGDWLRGRGNTKSILRMLSYALLPSIVALPLLIPQIAIYGNEIFKSEGDTSSADLVSNILFYASALLEIALGAWTLILVVIGTSEVQKISIGYSILNLILPVLVIVVPILLIVMIIKF